VCCRRADRQFRVKSNRAAKAARAFIARACSEAAAVLSGVTTAIRVNGGICVAGAVAVALSSEGEPWPPDVIRQADDARALPWAGDGLSVAERSLGRVALCVDRHDR
jgi:hypothetical protein